MQTHTMSQEDTLGMSYNNGGRDLSDVSINQSIAKVPGNHQKPGRNKDRSSPEAFRENATQQHLDFKLPD